MEKKIVKTISVKIKRPVDLNWKKANKILFDLRYNSSKALNYVIQMYYEWWIFSHRHKEKYGFYPKVKDYYSGSLDNEIWRELRKNFELFNSINISQTRIIGSSRWKNDKREIRRLEKSIPSFNKNAPIYISGRNLSVKKVDGKYYIDVSLLSKDYAKKNKIDGKQLFEIDCGHDSVRAIIDRIISGEYKGKMAQIIYSESKERWFVNISYEFEKPNIKLNKDRILGVDLGKVHPLCIAISDSYKRYFTEGGEIERYRKSIEARKNQILRARKYCGNGSKGRGRKTRLKPVEFAKRKISDFRGLMNHKYSRFVIEIALKHNCGVIQLEDLTGITKKEKFLKNWTYYDLQEKIKYKAEENNIEVEIVEPKYTSKRCSECGYIDSRNRNIKENQSKFKCLSCGHETNADYNAAKNLTIPKIDEIIDNELNKNKVAT